MSEYDLVISCGNELTVTAVAQEIVIDAGYVKDIPLRVENGYLEEVEPGVWMVREGERP